MKIILFISAFLISFVGVSQDITFNFGGKITNSDTGDKPEAGVTVVCLVNGKTISTTSTGSNGSYKLSATSPVGSIFTVVFSKPGLVSKRVVFNTTKMNPEDMITGGKQDMALPGVLFGERPGVDLSFLETEPVATSNWSEDDGAFIFDMVAIAKTKKKIADALAAGGKPDDTEVKYKAAIDAGAVLASQKKYEEAIAKYEAAQLIKPKETLPTTKIAELDKLIAAENNASAASAQLETEYKNLISAADNLRNQKKYTEATAKYNEALKKKSDPYPTGEINKMKVLLDAQKAEELKLAQFEALKKEGMDLATAKKLNEAKTKLNAALALKADPIITTKIKEIDTELGRLEADKAKTAKYDLLMSTADGLLASGKLDEAKAKYMEASVLEATQTLPKTKILEVNNLIVKKAKTDKLILEGNTAFAKSDWAGSKAKFEEVLTVDVTNEVAKAKLKEINAKLDANKGEAEKLAQFEALKKEGLALATAKKYPEAKNKLQQAIDMKPDAAISLKIKEIDDLLKANQSQAALEEDYKKLISEASLLESAKNYDGAIAKYKEAQVKKPLEAFPKTKITELGKLKAAAANSTQADAAKTALYNNHMASGAKNFAAKKYEVALTDFQNALSVKPSDSPAQSKISETQQILDNLANANNKNAEAKKQFDKIMAEAKKKFDSKVYGEAKTLYESALAIVSTDAFALKQVVECEKLGKKQIGDEENAAFNKIIAVADKKFNEKDYLKAKEYYERVLVFRTNDPYSLAQIDKINKLLNPTPVVQDIQPEKLQDLGIPFKEDDEAAQIALNKANLERENVKTIALREGVDLVNTHLDEKYSQKEEQHLKTNEEVERINKSISDNADNKSESHQDVIELIELEVKKHEEKSVEDNLVEDKTHQDLQATMHSAKVENSEYFLEKQEAYHDKATLSAEQIASHYDDGVDLTEKYDDKNIVSSESIIEIENTIIEKQISDDESRTLVEETISNAITQINDQDKEKLVLETEGNVNTKTQIDDAEKKIGGRDLIEIESLAETGNSLKILKLEVDADGLNSSQKDDSHGREVSDKLISENELIYDKSNDQKGHQQETNELLRQANVNMGNDLTIAYNDEMVKYLASQNSIKEKKSTVSEFGDEAKTKLIENNQLLSDRNAELSDDVDKQNSEQKNKQMESNQAIHDKQKVVDAVKPIIENSIGKEYKEGVTEEKFTQNDENGLMKSIITRRVVVIGGKGDVYVKTQSTTIITYTKNGSPINESVWQKETQGPHLTKNI